jgi:phage shock protein C
MSTFAGTSGRRLYRDADRALLGGVCAGLANYLGFNLKITRLLCVIAFLCVFPVALVAYLAAVLLIPVSSSRVYDDVMYEERRKDALRDEILRARPTVSEVRERYRSLEERLARIEKYVTSSRYHLDEEFRRL